MITAIKWATITNPMAIDAMLTECFPEADVSDENTENQIFKMVHRVGNTIEEIIIQTCGPYRTCMKMTATVERDLVGIRLEERNGDPDDTWLE